MIAGVFRRLFGNFREGALLHAKFIVGGNGGTTATFALKSNQGNANFGKLAIARTGVGLGTITLSGGARNIALLDCQIVPVAAADVSGSYGFIRPRPAFVEGTGVIAMRYLNNAGIAGEFALTAGDEVHVTLYVDK